MSTSSLDGFISCKGFAYTVCNKNATQDNTFIRLGKVSGVTGSHIKIECLLGNTNSQGITPVENTLFPTNSPVLLTIYGSFRDNAQNNAGADNCCNFEGYYTTVGNATNTILGVYVEYNENHYNYSVYINVNFLNTYLNYFVYLPNNCTWVNDGNSYNNFAYIDPSHWYAYPKL